MSLIDNQTQALWQDFMPRRELITNRIGNDYYSVQNYTTDYFEHFNPSKTFEKWAAVAVKAFENIPEDMESFTLPTGFMPFLNTKEWKQLFFSKFLRSGYLRLRIFWINDLILNYWAKNTKMEILIRRNKYGFQFVNYNSFL